jgi:putative Holliday junction resolvase
MGRVAALDLGEKSLGICISDEMQIIPIPEENYIFERYNLEQAKQRVIDLIEKYPDTELILLGYPLRTDGLKSDATRLAEEFKEMLSDIGVPVRFMDETNSTQDGIEMLSQTIKNKDKIKSLKDVAAAYIILKDYLGME